MIRDYTFDQLRHSTDEKSGELAIAKHYHIEDIQYQPLVMVIM